MVIFFLPQGRQCSFPRWQHAALFAAAGAPQCIPAPAHPHHTHWDPKSCGTPQCGHRRPFRLPPRLRRGRSHGSRSRRFCNKWLPWGFAGEQRGNLAGNAAFAPSTRSVLEWMVQFWRCSSTGRISSAHMAFISRGTPGISTAMQPSSSNQAPGAVPWALGSFCPLVGTMACLRLLAVGVRPPRPVRAKKVHDLLPFCFIKVQGIAKGFGHGLLGQVVLRGAKPAGKHQQIAAAFLASFTKSRRRPGLSPITC